MKGSNKDIGTPLFNSYVIKESKRSSMSSSELEDLIDEENSSEGEKEA